MNIYQVTHNYEEYKNKDFSIKAPQILRSNLFKIQKTYQAIISNKIIGESVIEYMK